MKNRFSLVWTSYANGLNPNSEVSGKQRVIVDLVIDNALASSPHSRQSFCDSLPCFSTYSFQVLSSLCIQSHISPQLPQLKSEVWFPSPRLWLPLMLNTRRLWGPPISLNRAIVLLFWTWGTLVTALLIGADKFYTRLRQLTMTLVAQSWLTIIQIMMDVMCSVASEEIWFDGWDLDVVLTASQKDWARPQVLVLSLSVKAWYRCKPA